MRHVVLVVALSVSLMLAAASATGAGGAVTPCGTVKGAGHTWRVTAWNVSCAFAKSWFPKLLREKWYGKHGSAARIKSPPGFQPCGVGFPTASGTTYIAIECLKNPPAVGAITFNRT
jgi:hypothetical protein